MPSKIRVLDEHTINKMAAGEVIENPASVVKELTENSLDAGATEICIEILTGGRQLIRITDNGCGMNADDALLCLERHATSKIRTIEDIFEVDTMGFRGEAIPSIAAISKFTLLTREPAADLGTMVLVEGGKIMQCCPVACSPGTTIEVKSLFFNLPVRRKFQKSPTYDTNEILKLVTNLSLGHPKVMFKLVSDHKVLINTPIQKEDTFQNLLGERIKTVLGTDFLEGVSFLEKEKEGYRVQGFVGQPGTTRHNRTGQYLFINQRSVVSPFISFAVRNGYGTALPTDRHPVYVLHLQLPGTIVDVNVHPQKREVRLRQEQLIKELLIEGISAILYNPSSKPFVAYHSPPPPAIPFNHPVVTPAVSWFMEQPTKSETAPPTFPPPPPIQKRPQSQAVEPTTLSSAFETALKQTVRVLATLKQFILVDGSTLPSSIAKEGICIIDQKAAHARILYEKLQLKDKQITASQTLLIPYTFTLTPIESAQLLNLLTNLNDLGLKIHQTGPNSFLIDAIPQLFGSSDLQGLIHELLRMETNSEDVDIFKRESQKQIALAASRTAISNNQRLTLTEAQSLMDQLLQCQLITQCPAGKPILTYLTEEELRKRFLVDNGRSGLSGQRTKWT